MKIVVATHSGMSSTEFNQIVLDWIATARHPVTKRLYTEMVYQPMLELTAYLRANGFKTFIVFGGGIDFMRPWTEKVYGIPPEQVVGSSGKTKFALNDGKPVLTRLPEIDFINDGPGKPVGINEHIGRRPIAGFGNSDGDMQMLQYTTAGRGARFGLIVHHTDAEREWWLDAVQDQRRWLSRDLFPEREPGERQEGQLASRAKGSVQPDNASLWPKVRGAHRQMESARDHEGPRLALLGLTPQ
jgi:hypothetical protein